MFKVSIVLVILLCLPLSRVTMVRGEGQTPADSARAWLVSPKYEASITGDVSNTALKQAISSAFAPSSNVQFSASLSAEENKYRLQDRKEINKSWTNSLNVSFMPGLSWTTNYSDTKVFSRIISLSGGLQDFISNTKGADSRIDYSTKLMGVLNCTARAAARMSSSEMSFIAEKSLKGEVGGRIGYKYGDAVKFSGRAAYAQSTDRSESALQTFSGLGEQEDSLASQLTVKLPQDAEIKVNYLRATKSLTYMDLPRGLYQEQKIEETDLVRETQMNNADLLSLGATAHPLKSVELKMFAEHSVDLNDFEITKKRYSRIVGDRIKGDLTYTYGSNNTVTFNADRIIKLRDLGPLSVSSYEQKEKRTTIAIKHGLTPTLSFSAQASAALSQIYYIDFDINPRDRDQLDQAMQVRVRSQPYKKITADVLVALSSTEFVYIDQSQSSDNRRETTYDLRPQFTFKLNDRIEIAQDYGLNIEFTDYVFTENENFLDRNITFGNAFRTKLSTELYTEFRYRLLFHDRGSYLRESPDEERALGITQEDRKDQIEILMRYSVNSNLTVVARHEYSRRRDRTVASGFETVVPDGLIEGGLEGKYTWGTDSTLSFTLLKVNRFGTFNTDAQNDYWVMKSNLKYAF